MATDLILKGSLTLGGTDVSAEVTAITIKATAVDVKIPATLAAGSSHAGGAVKYEATIEYLSTDGTTGTLFPLLWTAVTSVSKELAFVGLMRDGAESASNPSWTGTIVVSGADLGGDVEALSTGSITCMMTGAPTVLKT